MLLDSRFKLPADQAAESSVGVGGRRSALAVGWSFSSDAPTLDACEWRVSRSRRGEPEFWVKEVVGMEQGLAKWGGNGGDTELRDGYRYVHTMMPNTKILNPRVKAGDRASHRLLIALEPEGVACEPTPWWRERECPDGQYSTRALVDHSMDYEAWTAKHPKYYLPPPTPPPGPRHPVS